MALRIVEADYDKLDKARKLILMKIHDETELTWKEISHVTGLPIRRIFEHKNRLMKEEGMKKIKIIPARGTMYYDKNKRAYIVRKGRDYFGSSKNKDVAQRLYDICVENGWDINRKWEFRDMAVNC